MLSLLLVFFSMLFLFSGCLFATTYADNPGESDLKFRKKLKPIVIGSGAAAFLLLAIILQEAGI